MEYKNYKSARDLAWRVLLDGGVNSLPVQVSALCHDMGVTIKLYGGQEGATGRAPSLADRR